MPLSYPYKQNEEDKEIPTLTIVDDTMTPFEQLPPEEKQDGDIPQSRENTSDAVSSEND
ncbi:MAG: hypothetical protein K2L55_01160 [Muribaculaceae bacterium]|nr:hypothetical protein [Muribaculaceae bacterium]